MRALLLLLTLLSFPAFADYSKIANDGSELAADAVLGSAATDWACTRDNATGLTWEVKTTGGLRNKWNTYTHYDDLTQAEFDGGARNPTQAEIDAAGNSIGFVNAVNTSSSALCGFRDWKMPSQDELVALYPKINANASFFPNSPATWFWSGSPYALDPTVAWFVDFSNGVTYAGSQSYDVHVRLVRSGQSIGTFALMLSASGTGSGTLGSSVGSLNCTGTAGTTSGACTTSPGLTEGTSVTLTATAATGSRSRFTGWSGACAGSSSNCTVIMAALKSVTAGFALNSYRVSFDSNGGSAVSEQSIVYNSTASAPTAPTQTGYTFAGWYADSGLSTAFNFSTAIVADTTLYAKWMPPYSKIANDGRELAADAVLGSAASDWACTRDNATGLLWEVKTSSGLRKQSNTYTHYDDLTQAEYWNGVSYVNPTQAEIDAAGNSIGFVNAVNTATSALCGFRDWKMPSNEELLALVKTGSAPTIDTTFFPNTQSGLFWSGSPYAPDPAYAWLVNFYNGNTYTHDQSLIYHVRLVRSGQSMGTFALSLSASGSGSGTLSSLDGSIDCTSTAGTTAGACTASLSGETSVTLNATATGSRFTGWSGACAGSSPTCTVIMAALKSVTATFTLNTYAITASASPVAGGTVSCTPNPVNSGSSSTCTATPASGYSFSAFSGDCNGASCVLSNVTTAKAVTATFTLNTYAITASANPVAGGTVSCTPNPVNSGSSSTCTATAASGYSFTAWSGDCSGASCVLSNVTSTKSVSAGFTANSYNVSTDAVANGSISPAVQTVNRGASASFTVTPNSGYGIASATGCGGGVSGKTYTTGPITASCTVTVVLSATPTNGACGTDSGPTPRTGAPLNLCTTGAASLVYGSGPWNWTCSGSNGGSTASCSAAATRYAVTATAGTGGTINPASRTVVHGGASTFTLSPSNGYAIDTVSSACGTQQSSTLYTTGAVTAHGCAVTATFAATNTTTTIGTVSPSPSKVGQPVDIGYRVSGTVAGSVLGSDTVTVKDGAGSTLCTGTVTEGACTATFSSSGSKTLVASYTPSGSAQASASSGKNHPVADSPALATPSLPSGVVGISYATLLVASGGVPPYSFTATGLPAGFSLSTSGLLSGTASAAAAPTVSLSVTDALSQTASRGYTLSLVAQLTVASTRLPEGLVNAPYDHSLQAVGGKTPYVWSVTAGALPGGLTLNAATGQLSGTPDNLGSSANFTVQVEDANARTATQVLSLTTLQPTVAKTGGTTTLAANLTPSNGGATCTLDDAQTLVLDIGDSGAPATLPPNNTLLYGLFKMTIQGCTPGQTRLNVKLVYPAALPPGTQYWKYGKTAANTGDHWYALPSAVISGNTVSFSITDGGLGDDDLTADGSITDPGAPTSPTLAIGGTPGNGQVGSGYSAALTPNDGTGPVYNWSIDSGGLPAGVTLKATTGQLSGTPTTAGTFNFSVKLVDTSNSASKTQAFAVTIANPPPVDTGPWAQSINFTGSAPTLLVGGSGTLSASASSGLAVILASSTPSICRVTGATVAALAAGTCTVSANQPGNGSYYAAAPVTQDIPVGKGNQTVSFGAAPILAVGGSGSLSASASSGLAVSYSSSTAAVCTVTASTVTSVTGGTCSVAASQPGNANYNAAPQITQNISIGKAVSATGLSADPVSPALAGQTTTLTVRVSSSAGTPTGSVVFKDADTRLGTVAIDGSGGATYAGNLGVGLHALTASYAGDASYLASLGSLSYRVVANIDTTLGVRTQPNLSQAGESVPVHVTVTPTRNVGTLSGTVDVSSDGQTCRITLPETRCTLVFARQGVKALSVAYSGNSVYSAGSGLGRHFVGKRPDIVPSLSVLLD